MDVEALQRALDEIFDQGLVHHGFVDYMRDYELVVHVSADPRTGIPPTYLRYLFRVCVEARCRTALEPSIWRQSLDDRLIDYHTAVDLDGHVWGVKWQPLYPGASIVTGSASAQRWAERIGTDFHEVLIRANAHELTLVFSDLWVSPVPTGYAPFVVAPPDQSDAGE